MHLWGRGHTSINRAHLHPNAPLHTRRLALVFLFIYLKQTSVRYVQVWLPGRWVCRGAKLGGREQWQGAGVGRGSGCSSGQRGSFSVPAARPTPLRQPLPGPCPWLPSGGGLPK